MREPIQNGPHLTSNAWKAGSWPRELMGSAIAEWLRQHGFAVVGCDIQRERRVPETGIANLAFHNFSATQILAGVGNGLAEAMAKLIQLTKAH